MKRDIHDGTKKPPTIGVDEFGSMFIMTCDGAAASYFKGQWQPGIVFDGKDLMDFVPITDHEQVCTLMAQAEAALCQFLEQHKT